MIFRREDDPVAPDARRVRSYYEEDWLARAVGETTLFARMRADVTGRALAAARERRELASAPLLEIGPGLGGRSRAWREEGRRVIVADLARPVLEALRAVARGAQSEATRLPFRSGAFGIVHADSVMMHCDLDLFAAECRRVLVAGGRAVIAEPLAGNPWMRVWRSVDRAYAGIARWHSLDRIRAAFELRFRAVRCEPFYLNPPLTLLPPPLRAAALALDGLLLRRRPDLAWIVVVVADA